MTKAGLLIVAATVAAGIGAVTIGFAQNDGAMGGMNMGGMNMGGMTMGAGADTPSSKAYAAVMNTMMANMMAPYTGDADVDFVKGMIPHHQAAIDMAKVQLEFGKDPAIRAIAEEVIKAQEGEIAVMKTRLAAHGK